MIGTAQTLTRGDDVHVLDVRCSCPAGSVEDEATRPASSYRVIAYGAMPTGAVLGGALAAGLGLRAPFAVGTALVLALLVWFPASV